MVLKTADTLQRSTALVQEPIAHLSDDGREHSLLDHLEAVGALARDFSAKWGAEAFGEAAGRLHDLGKYAPDFQAHIRAAAGQPEQRRDAHLETARDAAAPVAHGRVDHSSAGALHAREVLGLPGEALAFVIAGHHAGLADQPALLGRLERKSGRLADALAGGVPDELLRVGRLELPFPRSGAGTADRERIARELEFWIRMLFSALCDADFLDTEAFFDSSRARARGLSATARIPDLLANLTAHVDAKQATAAPTEVNAVRRDVRAAARETASSPPGVFTLTVPTGGGKTLAAMEFALAHALAHGHDRVIVAIPYTAILEQNAEVYREALGDSEAVLEHHSSTDPLRETARSRLASQNWDAPIVVTTTVQLFESLFARRTSRCRKLHNIARSVIVLDEAQTLPPGLLEPTLEMLDLLVAHYGASLVVCTATQPAWRRRSPGRPGFDEMTEIVPESVRAFDRLRRVEVRWPESLAPIPYPQLAESVAEHDDVLVITHLRRDARLLTELLDERLGTRATVHLSALICPEHRTRLLAEVRERRAAGEPIRVVSTQLIEAGVDIDFPVVFRAMAGLDSLAQAAGRCNREGLLERGEFRIFVPETAPPPGVPRIGRAISEAMLRADPSLDLLSSSPHRAYFDRLYGAADTDAKDIQPGRAKFQFEQVAARYQLIEDGWSAPVVVPFGRAPDLLAELHRFGPTRARLRALGRFSVNVERRLVEGWLREGSASSDPDSGVVSLANHVAVYDDRFGLIPEAVSSGADPAALIIDG